MPSDSFVKLTYEKFPEDKGDITIVDAITNKPPAHVILSPKDVVKTCRGLLKLVEEDMKGSCMARSGDG
jgi:hypothetical protein